MKKAFSLVELMIVVAILGILAAIALPQFQSHATDAKETAAKNNLHVLRTAIELYSARNDIAPGYPSNNPDAPALEMEFRVDMLREGYLTKMPRNPFNDLDTFNVIRDDQVFPAEPTGQYGWVYMPQTKTMKLDWPGTDRKGTAYYDY